MKRLKQTTLHGLAVILLLFVYLCSYGQSRQEKTDLIIAKLKLVEGQKMMHQYRLDPLKQHVSGNDSVRIVELEKQLSEEQVEFIIKLILSYK